MLIGLTGTLGAGKGTVAEYLVAKKGYAHVSVSAFLAAEAARRGLEADRAARQRIANEFRAEGPTTLMTRVYERARDIRGNMILEPQHTVAEVAFIQERGGKVVVVDAAPRARYERIMKRGSAKDNVSFEAFSEHQRAELVSDDPNRNNLGAAMRAADFHIRNDGSLEELYGQVDAVLGAIDRQNEK